MLWFLEDQEGEQLSDLEIAWRSRDWEAVQQITDLDKQKPENELFSIINDLNAGRKRNVQQSDNYSKWFINNYFANFPECIFASYMSNMIIDGLSDQDHYNYMLLNIPRGKRFNKSSKLTSRPEDELKIAIIKRLYQVSRDDAMMYIKLLSNRGILDDVLNENKALITDDLIASVTKDKKVQKQLRNLI